MVGGSVVCKLIGHAVVQHTKLTRCHARLRMTILEWVRGATDETSRAGLLRHGRISLQGGDGGSHILSMHEKKMLQQLISHSKCGTELKKALLYVLGKSTDAIRLSTMITELDKNGIPQMKMQDEIIPLDEEAFKYLLQ